jgi:hypothetical protein
MTKNILIEMHEYNVNTNDFTFLEAVQLVKHLYKQALKTSGKPQMYKAMYQEYKKYIESDVITLS